MKLNRFPGPADTDMAGENFVMCPARGAFGVLRLQAMMPRSLLRGISLYL